MSHKKLYSKGNVPFSWEEKPGISKKICFQDVQPLPLHSVHEDSEFDDLGKIPPPPPCRVQPCSLRNASTKGSRCEEDPFLEAYKECTKSVKKGKLVAKKSKLFGFLCKSFDSCEIRDASVFKLGRDSIRVLNWK